MKTMYFLITTILLVCTGLTANTNSTNREIRGRCIEASSGSGIEGVKVSAQKISDGSLLPETYTDSNGYFQMSLQINESYTLTYTEDSYGSQSQNVSVQSGSGIQTIPSISF